MLGHLGGNFSFVGIQRGLQACLHGLEVVEGLGVCLDRLLNAIGARFQCGHAFLQGGDLGAEALHIAGLLRGQFAHALGIVLQRGQDFLLEPGNAKIDQRKQGCQDEQRHEHTPEYFPPCEFLRCGRFCRACFFGCGIPGFKGCAQVV